MWLADPVHAPVGYPWWITLVGSILVVLMVVALVWAWWWTRATQPRFAHDDELQAGLRVIPDESFAQTRARHLALIADLARRYDAGQIDSRTAHLQLAAIVRANSSARLGRDVRSLTATEFAEAVGGVPAAVLLHRYVTPSFNGRTAPATTTRGSIAAAQEVIQRW